MRRYSLFIVDDDSFFIQSVRLALGPDWVTSEDWKRADAALVDIHLSQSLEDFSGLKEIERLRNARSSLQIIATSGDLNRSTMEQALDAGCDLFLAKPLKPKHLQTVLNKVVALQQLRELPTKYSSGQMAWIGCSPGSSQTQKRIASLAGEAGPILIEGETGTGKEVVAHLLHQQEEKSRGIIKVNVAAISPALFESELFGHMKGSFTGAMQDKMGLIEAADGGDLFLDEIETLSLSQQAALLRFLENGEVKPVGGTKAKGVSVRVIAASNQSLEKLVEKKKFREDLFWRLAKHRINLPPLRERKDDIQPLANWFLSAHQDAPKELAADGLHALQAHNWPGNVRELKRVCEQLSLLAPLPIIRAEDVEGLLRTRPVAEIQVDESSSLADILRVTERQAILQRLIRLKDADEAARSLQVSRSSLYKKIKDYEIRWEKPV